MKYRIRRKNIIRKALATVLTAGLVACGHSPILVDTEFEDLSLKTPAQDTLIEFATFANRSTRAVATVSDLEFYHPTFKVYATKTSNGGKKIQPIFKGDTVTVTIGAGDSLNTWGYRTDRYWDKQADNYQFVAFAPAHAPLGYQHNLVEVNHPTAYFFSCPQYYTLGGQNLQEGDPAAAEKHTGFTGLNGADCDMMISDPFAVTEPSTTPLVSLVFKHTLAKLNVSVKANSDGPYTITVDSISIEGLLSTGTYDAAEGWVANGNDTVDYAFTAPSTDLTTEKTYFVESLVMPQDTTSNQVVTLHYTITSGSYSEEFTYTTTLAELFSGKTTDFSGANSYTVNFNIAPENNIITFDAGVTQWVEQEN